MKIHVVREEDSVDVLLIKHKGSCIYSYINLTKGHICPCRFGGITNGLNDLRSYPRVKSFFVEEIAPIELVEYVLDYTGYHGFTIQEDRAVFKFVDSCFCVVFNTDGSYCLEWDKVYRYFSNADDFVKTFHEMFDEVLQEVKGV